MTKEITLSFFSTFHNFLHSISGLCESDRIVVGDRSVGAFLTLMPEYCFVIESTLDGSIVAFASTVPDASQFHTGKTCPTNTGV